MRLTKKIVTAKNYVIGIGTATLLLLSGMLLPQIASAASGDAYFTLSPTSGSYTIGNNLILSVSETSTSADNTNAVQANLSYPSSLLQYKSITLDGPFTLCGQQTGGSGSVNIGCASTTTVSGTSPVAQITFGVVASGTAAVTMTSGSDIDNTTGTSVWNGVLPNASFTLFAATTPTTPPSSPPTTTTKKSSSTGSAKSTTSPTPTTPTTTVITPMTTAPSLASLSVTVVDVQGTSVEDAKVSLDKQRFVLTNSDGVANFSGVASGSYTIIASEKGKISVQSKLVITPGENKLLRLKLANKATNTNYTILGTILIILIIGGIVGLRFYRRKLASKISATPQTNTTVTPTAANDVPDFLAASTTLTKTPAPASTITPSVETPTTTPNTTTPTPAVEIPPEPTVTPPTPTTQEPTIIQPTEPHTPIN